MAFPDNPGLARRVMCAGAFLVILASSPVFAQQPHSQTPQAAEPAAKPVSKSTGSMWSTQSAPGTETQEQQAGDGAPLIVLTPEQIELLQKVDRYLNDLVNVQGQFIQTDYRNEETHGRFYVKRPGRLRFDYRAPSKLRIVSDGNYLTVEDHDLNTVDKYPLDATPIRLLLGEDVNLVRDSEILDMRQDETAVVIILKDKSGTTSGELQLYFRLPELELYEWVITDAQGLETRIQLANLVSGEEKSDEFFQASAIELENIGNN